MFISRKNIRQSIKPLGFPLLVVIFAWLLAWFYGIDSDGAWQLFAFPGTIAAGVWAWRKIEWHDSMAQYLAFGAAVLLMMALNRVLYTLDFLFVGERFSAWPFFATEPWWAVLKGEIATVLGTFLVVSVWLLAGGNRFSPAMVVQSERRLAILTLLIVFFGSVLGLGISSSDLEFASRLGQLLPTLVGLGAAAALFVPVMSMKSSIGRLALSALMSFPFIFVALGTGMKENIILSCIPLGFILWRDHNSVPKRTALVTFGVLFIGFVTTYVGHYREEVWQGGSEESQIEVLEQYIENMREDGLGKTLESGLEAFVGRSNASLHRGWAVSLADEYGHEPRLVFGPMVYVFIPRLIWPAKPQIRQGWEFSGLVFGASYISWSDSSTAAGLFGSLYLGGGWPAVILFSGILGWMIAGLMHLAFRLGGPLLAGLFTFSMVPFALRMDETWSVGAFSEPLISLVYASVLFYLARFAARILYSRKPGPHRTRRMTPPVRK